ncbi:MAG: hypothetical protein C5S48_00470 [Candidatus Methanogaster sp.]|nr:MAG: hypothetical protein C5S48_00470 [ANME-2 cluster archaeon]
MRSLTEPDLKISLIRLLKHILYRFRCISIDISSGFWEWVKLQKTVELKPSCSFSSGYGD